MDLYWTVLETEVGWGAGVDVYEGNSNGQVVFEAHMVSSRQGVASPLKGRRGSNSI